MKKHLIAMVLMPLMALADTEVVDGVFWTYTITDGKAQVGTGLPGERAISLLTRGSITIPAVLGGCPVTSIGDYALEDCSEVTSVTIPPGVTKIGWRTFAGCSGLMSVTIPPSVTEIRGSTFVGCSGLAGVYISDLLVWCSVWFGNSDANPLRYAKHLYLNGNEISELQIPNGVTSIGHCAFYGFEGLTSVTIPSNVMSIANMAFDGCKRLTSVMINEGVASIGDYAFYNCSMLSSVTIPSSVTSIGNDAFGYCNTLRSATVLSYYAMDNFRDIFSDGTSVKNIVIGGGVTSIKNFAFDDCGGLTTVTLLPGVTRIGDQAFRNCSGLISVMIPASVTSIGSSAFAGCFGLTTVAIPGCVARLSSIFPDSYAGISSVTICEGVTSIGMSAFSGCRGLASVTIPPSVTRIDSGAFKDCDELKEVRISDISAWCRIEFWDSSSNPTSYGHRLILNGKELTNLIIPKDVVAINDLAFYGCSNITSVTIPSNVAHVGGCAFYGCSGLKSVSLSDGVTSIGNYAFEECCGLSKIDVPSTVTNIGHGVFYNCSELVLVTIPSSVTSIGGRAFWGTQFYKDLPSGLIILGGGVLYEFKDRSSSSVTIPYGVTSIAGFAFSSCSRLTSVTFPNSIKSIENYAFEFCSGLTSIDIPPSVTRIGDSAFYGCDNLERVTLSSNVENVDMITFPENCDVVIRPYVRVDVCGTEGLNGYNGRPFEWYSLNCENADVSKTVVCDHEFSEAINVGEYSAKISADWFRSTNETYAVEFCTLNDADFTILPAAVSNDGNEPGSGSVPQGGVSKFDAVATYDGTGHTIDTNALMDVTLVADTPAFSYSLTSNGVFRAEPYCFTNACVTSVWYKISATNYEDYVHEARVTILPREVTLTSGTAQKKYDGSALTSGEMDVGGDSFVGEEGVTWTCTGSQTEVGSSENTFEHAFKNGTLASNYNITKQYGTLTVEYAGVTSSPQISPSEFFGDSGEVMIDCEMTDAVIRYTLDGTTPTEASAVYEGPIAIPAKDAATVVRAIAVRHGWMPSDVAEQRIVSLTPPDGSGNAVTNAAAVCHADNAGVLDITYDVAGNSSSNCQRVEVVVSVCGTNLTYVVAGGSVSALGAAGRHTVTADFSSVLNAAKGYSYVVKVGDSSVEVPNWAEGKEGLLVKDNWVYGHTDGTIRELEIPDGVVGIAAGAFAGFAQLETVSLPLTLRQICANAFTLDTHLTSIVLPEGLGSVGDEAFYGCTKMANVIVPGSVKSVGRRAFRQCTALTNAQIAYGVESIGDECFYSDWRISEVDLPSTVTNIGKEAFGGDSSIIRAGLRCDVRKMSEIFSNYRHIREIIVKEGDGEIVTGCFKDCKELKDVRYMGNCPALEDEGRQLYANTFASNGLTLVSYVMPESTGWDGIESSDQLPQAWPLVGGYRRPIAHWDVPTYLCRFDSNGGTLGVQDTYQYSEQDVVLPPEPVQSGYKFAGWWTQPVGGLRVTEKTIFIEGVYTYLWAHWVKGHTVFLDPNGGVVINGFVTYVEESVYGVLPTPVRSGYAFDGWLYNNEKIRPDTKINEMADHTLTAQWTANQYKVQYHPNGGTGELVVEEWVYGETNCLRRNAFVRGGYVFTGWATEEGSDEVVYKDCEPVANLTTEDGAVVELWAVWQESDAVDPTNVEFSFGGEANWEKGYELVSAQMDGHVVCTPFFWRSGKVADNEQSDMRTEVFGAGTIGFWWKVSCEQFRQEKLDHLSFVIDGVEQTWINGETDWAYAEFRVDEVAAHEFVWRYKKDWMDFDGDDRGSVCAIVWTPRLETLEDYAGTTNLTLVTSGDAEWFGVTNVAHNQSGSVRSGKIVDGQESRLDALAEGEGVVEFWWKTDCERFRDYKIDRVAFYVDGSELAWTNGVTDWQHQRFKVSGAGTHTLSWVYIKDDEGSAGEDCAWLCDIHWMPTDADDPIPELDPDAEPTAVRNALEGSADARLAENITTAEHYRTYREWALKIGATDVKASPFAWVSFATDSAALLAKMPTDDDLKVEEFKPSAAAGSFDFTVSVKDVKIGDKASVDNLKKLFGLEGAESLDTAAFSSENVSLDFKEPQDGKLKFTATPAVDNAKSFFMKAKVK